MAFDPATPRDAGGRFISPRSAEAISALEQAGVFTKDLEGWMAGSEVVHWAKLAKAKEVQEYWQSIAPVRGDKPAHESKEPTAYGTNFEEDYKNSIKVTEHDGTVAVGTDLMPLGKWLEYGSIHNPEHGYGARVLEHFGGGPVNTAERISDKLFIG
jgi:hypothetical protein